MGAQTWSQKRFDTREQTGDENGYKTVDKVGDNTGDKVGGKTGNKPQTVRLPPGYPDQP